MVEEVLLRGDGCCDVNSTCACGVREQFSSGREIDRSIWTESKNVAQPPTVACGAQTPKQEKLVIPLIDSSALLELKNQELPHVYEILEIDSAHCTKGNIDQSYFKIEVSAKLTHKLYLRWHINEMRQDLVIE